MIARIDRPTNTCAPCRPVSPKKVAANDVSPVLKPTYGLVPTDGVFPLAPTFDHAGPMALSVDGCAELLGIAVPDVGELVPEHGFGFVSYQTHVYLCGG